MSYIGNTQNNQNYVPAIDYFNGNGSTVAFTLSRPVASVAAVQAVINNVPQNPGDAFTVSGSTITFTSAPPSGTNNIYVYYTSPNTQVIQPGQGTVGPTQVDGNYALWNKNGSDINYTAGNVGVGTSSPAVKLHVQAASQGVARFQSTDSEVNVALNNSSASGNLIGAAGANFYFYSGGSERMRIDSSGRVTMPYQPVFRAYSSVSVTGTGVVTFNSTLTNVGSYYNTSNGVFTAPVAGNYMFTVAFRQASVGSIAEVEIQKNGVRNILCNMNFSNANHQTFGGIITLAANDTVRINSITNVQFDNGIWDFFCGHLIA